MNGEVNVPQTRKRKIPTEGEFGEKAKNEAELERQEQCEEERMKRTHRANIGMQRESSLSGTQLMEDGVM